MYLFKCILLSLEFLPASFQSRGQRFCSGWGVAAGVWSRPPAGSRAHCDNHSSGGYP